MSIGDWLFVIGLAAGTILFMVWMHSIDCEYERRVARREAVKKWKGGPLP